LVAGSFSLVKTPGGSSDIYIIKYDSLGNVTWATSFGGAGFDDGTGIITDAAGNIYISGDFYGPSITIGSTTLTNAGGLDGTSDAFLVKYDPLGNIIWVRGAGSTDQDYAGRLAVDATGNILMVGTFSSPSITFGSTTLFNTSGTSSNFYIVKYDSSGNNIWAKKAGSTSDENAGDIKIDLSGNVIVSGAFKGPSIVFGSTTLTNASSGSMDLFLVKYDGSGNVIWAKRAGGTAEDSGRNLSVDASGNIFVTGYFLSPTLTIGATTLTDVGAQDILIAKYDSSGNPLWAKSIGNTGDDRSFGCVVDGNGNLCVMGFFSSTSLMFGTTTLTSNGSYDLFVAKYNSIGNLLWAKSAGGTSIEFVYGMAVDSDNNLLIAGSFYSSSVSFGTITINNGGAAGSPDLFVVKISGKLDVWPGDADHNNVADNSDLLPIGLFYGQTGTSRATVSNAWQAYTSTDWGTLEPDGVDIKSADCNGDGFIDNNDTLAVNLNFSLTHAYAPIHTDERMTAPDLHFVTSSGTYTSGSTVDVEVWAGSSTLPVSNLYGLAFTINYDGSLVQPATESLTYPTSWLGTPGTDAIKIGKIDAIAAKAYGAETRIDHVNASGFGKIADFKFQLKSSIPSNTVMHFSSAGYSADNSIGTSLVFNTPADSIIINPSALGVDEINNETQISVYPNPSNGSFNLFISEPIKNGSVEVYNSLGELVLNEKITNQQNAIDLKDQMNGLYFLKVMSDGKIVGMDKIIKQ
ncbi:MAG: T9SS type A sorting domain-containing protein, partial [Bacteroidia bacterium]